MPYRSKEDANRASRIYHRRIRHGNWRQVYVDCWGMCQNRLEDGSTCGCPYNLDFHDIFGEDHKSDGRMSQLVLMCLPCHNLQHGFGLTGMLNRPYCSKLTEDVNWEIQKYGGLDAWMKHFGLTDNPDSDKKLEDARTHLDPRERIEKEVENGRRVSW